MPHINSLVDAIRGPIVQILVGVSAHRIQALNAAGLPVPNGILVDFLVDTGASSSVVDQSVIAPLGLTPTGYKSCHTPSTGTTAVSLPEYDLGLLLVHDGSQRVFPSLSMVASDFSMQNIHGLLGRDVLSQCLLVYDGKVGGFALAF